MSNTEPTIAGELADAAQKSVIQQQPKRKGPPIPPVEIDIQPLTNAAYRAGESDGSRNDADSTPIGNSAVEGPLGKEPVHDGHLADVATQVVVIALHRLGRFADAATAQTHELISGPLATARTGRPHLNKLLMAGLVALFTLAEIAAGFVIYNLVFKQWPMLSVIISVVIALVLAITGFLLAQAFTRTIGTKPTMIISAILATVMIGFMAAGAVQLRTAEAARTQASDSVATAQVDQAFGDKTNEIAEAQSAQREANTDFDRGAMWLFIGLIGLPVSAGLLAKTLQIMDDEKNTVTLNARTQRNRTQDLAAARHHADRLVCYLSAAQEILAAHPEVWYAYLSGYRSASPADVADRLTATPPPMPLPIGSTAWIDRLGKKIDYFHSLIDTAETSLALQIDGETATDLLPTPPAIRVPSLHAHKV